jgi:hypothetical protein
MPEAKSKPKTKAAHHIHRHQSPSGFKQAATDLMHFLRSGGDEKCAVHDAHVVAGYAVAQLGDEADEQDEKGEITRPKAMGPPPAFSGSGAAAQGLPVPGQPQYHASPAGQSCWSVADPVPQPPLAQAGPPPGPPEAILQRAIDAAENAHTKQALPPGFWVWVLRVAMDVINRFIAK